VVSAISAPRERFESPKIRLIVSAADSIQTLSFSMLITHVSSVDAPYLRYDSCSSFVMRVDRVTLHRVVDKCG
jgi:hypothetical protein